MDTQATHFISHGKEAENEALLRCEAIAIEREGLALIAKLNFTAAAGDIWIIQGSNGVGKSTLLAAVAGLYPLSDGKIFYGEHEIMAHPQYPENILYLGHKQALKQSMSVYDNVAFWAKLRGTESLINAALQYFDLEPYREMRCDALSAGWQQRVVLTRLLTMPSSIWLLDEPMTHLDNDAIALLQSLISLRAEQRGIVLMTSHAKIQSEYVKILNINAINR